MKIILSTTFDLEGILSYQIFEGDFENNFNNPLVNECVEFVSKSNNPVLAELYKYVIDYIYFVPKGKEPELIYDIPANGGTKAKNGTLYLIQI